MADGDVIYQGTTRNGISLVLRYPTEQDAQELCDYINALSRERTFIHFQGEHIPLEDETRHVRELLEHINQHQAVCLLAIADKRIVGYCAIRLQGRVMPHEGVFGITVAKEFRGQGIGQRLMETVVAEATKTMKELRIVTLGVFGNNQAARDMYTGFGFREYGRLPRGILHHGHYVDHIFMYKNVR